MPEHHRPVVTIQYTNAGDFEAACVELLSEHYGMRSSGVYPNHSDNCDVWWAIFVKRPTFEEE